MERWEYDITSHRVDDMMGAADHASRVITCDPEGVCLSRDMPAASRAALRNLFNERGAAGWELVETHYGEERKELACIWKRKRD